MAQLVLRAAHLPFLPFSHGIHPIHPGVTTDGRRGESNFLVQLLPSWYKCAVHLPGLKSTTSELPPHEPRICLHAALVLVGTWSIFCA
ncbi:hypothetical protein GGI35DRAFT_376167 [Trichoderma velutinum]